MAFMTSLPGSEKNATERMTDEEYDNYIMEMIRAAEIMEKSWSRSAK